MGPIIIFDKSALQALSVDEAVWLDAFFSANVVPVFYVETLADLEKKVAAGKTPEEVVGRLAEKTPSSAYPNAHHHQLVLRELAGEEISMTNRPLIVSGERMKQPDGSYGAHIEFPEEATLERWANHQFLEIERETARAWRADLAQHEPDRMIGLLKNILPADPKVSTIEDLAHFIDDFCATSDPAVIALALEVLMIPDKVRTFVVRRWIASGRPKLDEFVPYCTHVFKVDLLYYLGMYRSFISSERASNRVDMAYLYYLPFAAVFVSGDKLHHRTVPLLQRRGQSYVTAQDLKAALADCDRHYDGLPEAVKALGVMSFAQWPPSAMENLITHLWDIGGMVEDWRDCAKEHEARLGKPRDAVADRATIAELHEQIRRARPMTSQEAQSAPPELDYGVIRRQVPVRKGKWRIVSKDVEDATEGA